MDSSVFFDNLLLSCCVLLSVCVIFGLIRAVRGPRFTDRIVAVNLIGTITILIMCILSVYFRQSFLADIAIVYALLSFIAVVVLARLVIVRRLGQLEREQSERRSAEQRCETEENGK